MADTVRERIVQAMVTALDGGPAPVMRKRLDALETEELPAFVIAKAAEPKPGDGDYDSEERTFSVQVYCVVGTSESDDTAAPDKLADPLEAWAEQKLVGEEFSGLAKDVIYAGTQWVSVPGQNLDIVGSVVTFEVTYWTTRGDPTAVSA